MRNYEKVCPKPRQVYDLIQFERRIERVVPARELLIGLWNSDIILSINQYKKLKEYYGDKLDYEVNIRKISLLVKNGGEEI